MIQVRNMHEISSTTFITQNFYFRLNDLVGGYNKINRQNVISIASTDLTTY